MVVIKLTQGKEAIIDDRDNDKLSAYNTYCETARKYFKDFAHA